MKNYLLALFVLCTLGMFAQPVANCSLMCVLDIQLDTTNNEMIVTLFSGDTNGINYPTIQVIDQNGDTVGNAAGTFTLFMQGQGTVAHHIPTTITGTLPQPFNCTVLVTDQVWDTTCTLTYPMSCPMNVLEQGRHDKLSMYPNPATDILTIDLPSRYSGKAEVHITNTLGEVFAGEVPASNGRIDLNVKDLACGAYFVTVLINDTRYTQRIIRQ